LSTIGIVPRRASIPSPLQGAGGPVSDPLIQRLDPASFADIARHVLDAPSYEWIRSGAGDEQSLRDNEAAFSRRRLRPHVLVDVARVNTATTVLGADLRIPVGVAPLGLQKVMHPDGELAMADGVARTGSLLIVAVNATVSIEDIATAQPGLPLWFQLYNWDDRDALAGVVARAEAAGAKAIVPLVNTAIGVSHTPWRVGFRGLPAGATFAHFTTSPGLTSSNTWEYLEWLASRTSLPIVPKGVMSGADAARAVDAGAKGVIVSNHGGRQLPRALATLDALPEVVAAVAGRAEVYLDGGVRSGSDVLIALALGARAVFIGRPAAWGLAVGGGDGVARVLDTLRGELADDAGLCGIDDIAQIPRDVVVDGAA
jgi:4-hydroxymandelate oxidase